MAIPTSYGYVYVTVYVTPTLQGIGDSSSGLVNGFLYVLFTKKVRRTVLINPCSSCTHSLRGKWRGRGGEREPILGRAKVGGGASLNAPSSCKWQEEGLPGDSSEIFTPNSLNESYQSLS